MEAYATMARKAAVGFTFYASDWLTSQRILAMKPEQEGAYVRLLAYAWEDPECSIPIDDRVLASMSRLGSRWPKLKEKILKCFENHPTDATRLINSKLYDVRKEQAEFSEERRKSGSLGGRKRWQNHGIEDSSAISSAIHHVDSSATSSASDVPIAEPLADYKPPSPLPSPSSVPRKEPQKPKKRARPIPDDFESNDTHRRLAEEFGVNLPEAVSAFRDHAKANGRLLVDWDAGLCGWIRNVRRFDRPVGVPPRQPTTAAGITMHNVRGFLAEDGTK